MLYSFGALDTKRVLSVLDALGRVPFIGYRWSCGTLKVLLSVGGWITEPKAFPFLKPEQKM